MNVSDYGAAFIAGWEGGAVLRMYNDDGKPSATSKGNCTIGIGSLIHEKPCDGRASEAPYRNGITYEQALAMFRSDLANRVAFLNRILTRQLNQDQFDAYLDFAYNCGLGAAQSIVSPLNAGGDFCALTAPFIKPPQFETALRARRRDECQLWHGNKPAIRGGIAAPPATAGEDEMWKRHNEAANNAFWKDGKHTFKAGETVTLQLTVDLPRVMALAPSAIDLDLFGRAGMGGLDIEDGDGRFAGRLNIDRSDAVIRVVPVNGAIKMRAVDGPATVGMGVVGYLE